MTRWIPAARALPMHELSEVDRAICRGRRAKVLLDQWSAEDAARGPSAEPVDWPEPIALHRAPDDPGEPDGERRPAGNLLLWAIAIIAAGLFAWGLVQCFGDLW